MTERERSSEDGRPAEKILHVEKDEPDEPPDEITLDRDQALRDLRDLQDLSVERASGRSSPPDD